MALFLALTAYPARADTFRVDEDTDVVGGAWLYRPRYEETLLDVARDNDLGFGEIAAANPDVDTWFPSDSVEVVVPTSFILPPGSRDGIILNLAEMRLYRFHEAADGSCLVTTHPVGVGREGWDTPLGVYYIPEKQEDPVWRPPKALLEERPELPPEVGPGPDNPLGRFKMRLSYTTYLMHGTNRPWGVGRRVSHGCIRLYPEDMEVFFHEVPSGERVEVVYQPVKVGRVGNRVFVEVHKDYLNGKGYEKLFNDALGKVIARGWLDRVDIEALLAATRQMTGMPVDVTR